MTFEKAWKKLPECCIAAAENCSADSGQNRIQDLIDGVEHELQMAAEGQDGCITPKQVKQCKAYLSWLRKG